MLSLSARVKWTKSRFNDSAYRGLESAQQSYGIRFKTADSGTFEENTSLLQQWAEADCDLIIALSHDNGPAITHIAERFPKHHFAIIDTSVERENVWSAVFREYETDYALGVFAALITGEDRQGTQIGFIGGNDIPVIRRIEAAFRQGIESVNPDSTLNVVYIGSFSDEALGQDAAETLYSRSVNVIYQAAGRSGLGVIRTAEKLGKFVISTGGDHSELAPSAVLTSRIKNVDRPVQDIINAVAKTRFEGGKTASYGIADGGLTLAGVRSEAARRLIQSLLSDINVEYLKTRMDETIEAVSSGRIVVDLDLAE